jgi:hypothetical protein
MNYKKHTHSNSYPSGFFAKYHPAKLPSNITEAMFVWFPNKDWEVWRGIKSHTSQNPYQPSPIPFNPLDSEINRTRPQALLVLDCWYHYWSCALHQRWICHNQNIYLERCTSHEKAGKIYPSSVPSITNYLPVICFTSPSTHTLARARILKDVLLI